MCTSNKKASSLNLLLPLLLSYKSLSKSFEHQQIDIYTSFPPNLHIYIGIIKYPFTYQISLLVNTPNQVLVGCIIQKRQKYTYMTLVTIANHPGSPGLFDHFFEWKKMSFFSYSPAGKFQVLVYCHFAAKNNIFRTHQHQRWRVENFKAFGLKNFSYERGAFCQKKYSGKSDAFIILYIPKSTQESSALQK